MREAKYAGDPFCFCDMLLIFIYGPLADIFSLIYNLGNNILKLYIILAKFPVTTSKAVLDIYHKKQYISCITSCQSLKSLSQNWVRGEPIALSPKK